MASLQRVNSPERGVLVLGQDGLVLYANTRAAEVFGISLPELLGNPLPSVITDRPCTPTEVIEEVLDGTLAPNHIFHRYSTPVYSVASEVAGRLEVYSDITIRRELEKEIVERSRELAELNSQLREAQEQLVQSERLRALGEMAAGVAHDINNVLGIILGNAQLAKRKLPADSSVMECMDAIEMASRDAAETVRRLREIGRPIDTSSYAPVDLSQVAGEVVRAIVSSWHGSAPSSNSDISVRTHLSGECVVFGDATEIREALANVLLNAAQSICGAGSIEISTCRLDDNCLLTVVDDGAGMTDETRLRIFDPFFTTRGAEGTGLGMSMVHAIMIRHGGGVIVESDENSGTRCVLRFPCALSPLRRGEQTN